MNSALMFSKASDEWSTPQELFDALHAEFNFTLDAAASSANAKCPLWFGPEMGTPFNDALRIDWWIGYRPDLEAVWLNPPYSKCREFIAKAALEARRGVKVVCLVPSRTDTRWWHEHVWDADKHQPRPGVEIRFIKGRLKFGNSENSAPFPSVVIVFRPVA
jgi:phage N-6-adenine-methyltransferase